jgi:nucleoside-diphosphate-sugar epimerase
MRIIISGVAGFIESHAAVRFLPEGMAVIGFDNLSRRGRAENLAWDDAVQDLFQAVLNGLRS